MGLFNPNMRINPFHIFFALTVFSFNSTFTFAQSSLSKIDQMEEYLSYFRLQQAESMLQQFPSPTLKAYYQTQIQVYRFLSTQDPIYLQKLEQDRDKHFDALANMAETDTLKEIFQADLYARFAVVEFINHNYFSALRFARKSGKLIQQHQKKYGDHIEQYKIRGLFNVLFGSVPGKYQWISQSLGYHGDVQLGLSQLEKAAAKSRFLRMESFLIVAFVRKNMLNQPEAALTSLLRARKQKGANILIDFSLASAYMNKQQNEEAIKVLSERKNYVKGDVFFIPYWDYLYGKAWYFKENHSQAQYYFSRFLKTYRGELLKRDAYFRLGLSLTLSGDYEAGLKFFQLIEKEEGGFNEDEYASFMAATFVREAPNEHLLNLFRARNLFDGGYTDQSLAILNQINSQYASLPTDIRIELHYRYGRVYHRQQNTRQAVSHYQQCIRLDTEQQNWLQAYAMYYQGEIAREEENLAKAKSCYESALEYDDYFYQDGLENRCKIILNQLERELKSQTSPSSR